VSFRVPRPLPLLSPQRSRLPRSRTSRQAPHRSQHLRRLRGRLRLRRWPQSRARSHPRRHRSGQLKPKQAAIIAYLGQALVQAIRLAGDEPVPTWGPDTALRHRLHHSPPLDPAPPASSTADPQPGSPPPAGFAPAAADATVVAGHTPDPSRRAEQADDSCSRSLPVNGRPGERRPFQVFSLARSNGKCGNPGTTHAGKISLTQRRRRLCLAGFSPPETIDPTGAVTLVGGALAKL
jgi:hypothetical protein